MKIILSNAPINNGNRGCVALSYSVMFLLDELLRSKGIEYELYLSKDGLGDNRRHSIKVGDTNITFISLADISATSVKQRLKQMFKYKSLAYVKRVYQEADFILDIGQGDSFADIYGKERFDWIFSQYELGMKYKKTYGILPQTIGPFTDEDIRKRAVEGIRYARCVMARDKQSYNYVKELVSEKDVSEIIDVAFFMPYKRKAFDKNFVHVGLNVSALLWHGGYTRNNQFGLKVDYQALIHALIKHFLLEKNVVLHLIPHVVGSERHVENDYAVSYDLCEAYGSERLILAPLFLDPIAAKNYIAGMDFFMGARMHSTIAAFSSGVPVVPMAYSRKFNGLFVDTLQYPYVADMKAFDIEENLRKIISAYTNKNKLVMTISDRMTTTVQIRKDLLMKNLQAFIVLERH